MFRVMGRDARGAYREISVCAATEAEARAQVLSRGDLAAIDQVTSPAPLPPPRTVKLSGWTVTILGCLICLAFASVGGIIGGWAGHVADESSGDLLKFDWFFGGIAGALIGLFCGVGVFVVLLKRFWKPS